MARGPFQGTWQQGIRPTIVTAPDALVHINGEPDILGCGTCRRRFDWNKYITSIQVDLNVDSAPGSASFNLSIPRHSVDEFYFDGNPLITPMMEVEIYAKGYFLVEGLPQYYPIFWGLVTEVSESYSGGAHTFSVNCSDILKWWEHCKMNVNPAFTQPLGQLGRNIFGNVFFGTNPYDIIWTLAQQSFGDVVVGTGSLVSMYKEQQQKQTFNAALSDIMQYWNQRFSQIRSNLLLYGTRGTAVRGDLLYSQYKDHKGDGQRFASQAVRQANGGPDASQLGFDPTDPEVQAFRTQFSQAGQVNFWQSEYQTKLEVANAAKEAIGYEFYMDVTGDIVFKPPFYNLDILSNKPVSWIQDIDIIDYDLSQSEAEVVTQIQLQGSYAGNVDYGFPEEATPFTSVTDYHLLRKYGWRTQTFNSEFMADPVKMFYVGMDMLDRMNSKRHRGTVNVPLRPELRLGFPVYLASKDQIWYVQGISHNIQFGGRATTTLTLTAKRQKFLAPKGIGSIRLSGYKGEKSKGKGTSLSPDQAKNLTTKQLSSGGQFEAKVGDAAQLPPTNVPEGATGDNPYEPLVLRHPKTGRLVGYPNVVMAYTRPFIPTDEELAKVQGRYRGARKQPSLIDKVNKAAPEQLRELARGMSTFTDADRIREKHLNNRYTYGLNSAGVYTYLHDESKVIQELLLLPAKNVSFSNESFATKHPGMTGMIRPVSDERGFELIGHFRYGRGVALSDGALVLNETHDSPNARAEIGVQAALAGGLYESLQAQSQGLSAVTTSHPNPATAIAKLTVEDQQTAGVISPETGEPEFAPTAHNFVDTAPLGSPENVGLATNLEASQLSRALTLAEMSVREPGGDADCSCLLGRADLAFINVGYQVQFFDPTTGDNATLRYGSVDERNIAAAQQVIERGQATAAADPLRLFEEPGEADVATQDEILREASELSGGEVVHGLVAEAIREGRPVADYRVASKDQTIARVEAFLTSLYESLDSTHHEYERALRGELIPQPPRSAEQLRFGDNEPQRPRLAPPFSSPGRAHGGDPRALAQQGSSAMSGIEQAWSNFGTDLQANSSRAELQAKIERDQNRINSLEDEKERLQQAQAAGSTRISPDGDIGSRLAGLEQDLASAKQSLRNNQAKLAQLNQRTL